MTDQITIAGRTFNVPTPFAEGHVLTAGQASALNQTFHENVRNNLAKKLDGKSDEESQTMVDEYAASYEFGVRTGGGGFRGDPVKTEAMEIARQAVRKALQKKGHKISGKDAVPAAEITRLAGDALAQHPEWLEVAQRRVAEAKELLIEV